MTSCHLCATFLSGKTKYNILRLFDPEPPVVEVVVVGLRGEALMEGDEGPPANIHECMISIIVY